MLVAAALVLGCSDDGTAQGSGTEGATGTGTGTGGAMTTAGMSAGMTTMGEGSGDTSTGGPPPGDSTAAMEDTMTPMTGTDTGMATGSTGGGNMECEMCVAEECGEDITACGKIEECMCWLDCIDAGMMGGDCFDKCGGPPPDEFDDVQSCIEGQCQEACEGGGTTGGTTDTGGTTGGVMKGFYEECQGDDDCPEPLVCNGFLNYCSIDECQGDDDCPPPASGDAEASCSGFGTCVLDCGDGEMCPDGMDCSGGMNNDICEFP